MMKLNSNVACIEYKNKVILANKLTGMWLRITKEIYNYFIKALELNYERKDFVRSFMREEDQIYIGKLLDKMEEIGILGDAEFFFQKSVAFEITNRCNLTCMHCCFSAGKQGEEMTTQRVIPYKQLLSGKLLILLLLTISFSLIGCVIALVINIIVGFPGVHFGNLLNMFIRVTGANIGIYISVLPIILLFCCSANYFLGGVALAFIYGYFGTFEGTLLNYYPIKASMILVDSTCGAEYGYTYHIFPALITITLTFLISIIILANKKKAPGTLTVTKKKKVVRKKGW